MSGTPNDARSVGWPMLADYPQTAVGVSHFLLAWSVRKRRAVLLSNIPMKAIDENRRAHALMAKNGWKEIDEED